NALGAKLPECLRRHGHLLFKIRFECLLGKEALRPPREQIGQAHVRLLQVAVQRRAERCLQSGARLSRRRPRRTLIPLPLTARHSAFCAARRRPPRSSRPTCCPSRWRKILPTARRCRRSGGGHPAPPPSRAP